MASFPPLPHPPSRAAPHLRGVMRWVWALAALAGAMALRFVPLPAMLALDRMPLPAPASVAARPADSFPGSAYFLAEDAFAPVDAAPADTDAPGVTTLAPGSGSPHILQIERGPAALSMALLRAAAPLDQARALQCLTSAIYYEAGNEPEEGQRAVAQVILNRLASGRWPTSVCGVVYQGTERADRLCQFTFSCDGSMARTPNAAAWARARGVAWRALSGDVFAPAGLATFYHTLAVRPPWADKVRPVAVIGAHIFYRLPGEGGDPATYRMRYAGRESAQPGPYAFTAPPRPLPAPPGPDQIPVWTMPPAVAAVPAVSPVAPPAPSPLLMPAPVTLAPPPVYAPPAPPPRADDRSGLPQSTIRPEYRNTGRPLR